MKIVIERLRSYKDLLLSVLTGNFLRRRYRRLHALRIITLMCNPSNQSWMIIMVVIGISTSLQLFGQDGMPKNPFIKHMFTADPSAHVWNDGRLYVYPSHDIAPPRGADLMDQYHVFSTNDMVNWTDHGEILRSSDVPWGRQEGGFMWAPDCAYKNGIYYFYFPHPSGTEWNSTWKIGVATSSKPASDFTVQGYIPGLESLIDPCVFIDEDGQAYFYHGGGGVCRGGKLKDNMMEIDGEMQQMSGLVDFHEATWVHKRNGIYYLSYSDNHDDGNKHNRMRYATSANPLGPWTYRGIYMDPTDSYTNHGSIVEYKGQWYAFYHNSALSGNDWLRSVCVDKLYYNEDGTIQVIAQTKGHGTPYGGTPWTIPGLIEAEDYDEGGPAVAYSDSDTVNNGHQYRLDEFVDVENCSEGGYNVGWLGGGEWLEYTVNVLTTGAYTVELRVASASTNGSSISIEMNGEDKTGKLVVPNTSGWQTYTTISKEIELQEGKQIMRLLMGDGAFNITNINFKIKEEPETPVVTSADYEGNDVIKVYPSPSSGKITIELPRDFDKQANIKLYDSKGNLITEEKAVSRKVEMKADGIHTGVYLLKVNVNHKSLHRKIVIQ